MISLLISNLVFLLISVAFPCNILVQIAKIVTRVITEKKSKRDLLRSYVLLPIYKNMSILKMPLL